MNIDKTYILNPAYFLRNDIYRALIGTFDNCSIEPEKYDYNALYIYCYADRRQRNKINYLSTEKIISIIKEAKKAGIISIDVNGGEVLMHPQYKEILKELSDNEYRPLISTKIPLDEKTLEYLSKIGMTRLQISLDSLNSLTLTKMLKVKSEYKDKILNTLQMLDDMKFEWQVNTVITKLNSSLEYEIKPLMSKLTSYKNIKRINVRPAAYSMYKSQENFEKIKINIQKETTLEDYMQQLSIENKHIKITLSEQDQKKHYSIKHKKDFFSKRPLCTANQRAFIILPDYGSKYAALINSEEIG